ncbi:hypothetical protein OG302_01680 [Streptomyces sp. NBC_01283]|uniref:TetR family transcriptional regulator C-terminal domain-containing protein n=1 Tax=Streptomyces sp. NBC_01283 TaxID=2903812 RepID=UPI00352BF801|nr:hypothetical protein OG302_01680 [Streptomyces sp. NBC_01283]
MDAAATPAEKLLALFDAVSVSRDRYTPGRGCAFLATGTELPDLDHPVHAVIEAESTLLLARLNQLAEAVTTEAPAALVGNVLLVYDGAMAGLQRGRMPDPLGHGKTLARRLIQNAIESE